MPFMRLRATDDEFAAGTSAPADGIDPAVVRSAHPMVDTPVGDCALRLADGTEADLHALTPHFRQAVHNLHERCSAASRRFRYFSAMPSLPPRMFDRLCDRGRGISVAACHDGQVRAMANLMYCAEPGAAELALLVEDAWQGRGLGAQLARTLVDTARERAMAEVRASIMAQNERMRRLMISLGAALRYTGDPGVIEARLPLTVRA
ncbi:GNAT family N-acetyltransferase [Nonomuraea fuscirosea]|uniref:GNAT family N-acetyltransferase n=1 Tax=Nonomuraea fuscirosea TaxID=1291556 RepID=UPI002DDBCEEE|nr:GNAT family N-acetyltransferase [Nonomuraea fuscirosea]WSA56123.1 GNAT family N-acetyltransferase [Nonomuraea fuscirosea]